MPDAQKPSHQRFSLLVMVTSAEDAQPNYVTATARVWDGDTLRETVQVLHFEPFSWPDDVEISTLENYAVTAASIVRRLLDEKLYEAVQSRSLHHVSPRPTVRHTDEPAQ